MELKEIQEFHEWFSANFEPLLGKRYSTFYQALLLAVARKSKTIVETGTSRDPGNWGGDGQSTVLLSAFAERYGCKLYTCDIEPGAIELARLATQQFAPHVELAVSDSVAFLQAFREPIDLLYLDSMDFASNKDPNPPQNHALAEAQAALPKLHADSIVLFDDCALVNGGKGGKAIPYLITQGWQVIGMRYQVLLTRQFVGK